MLLESITLLLLNYFTAFAFIYSTDKAKIWGDLNNDDIPDLKMPGTAEVDTENMHELQKHIETVITPAALYFSLYNDINRLQKNCDESFINALLVQLISLVSLARCLMSFEIINEWLISLIVSVGACSFGCFIIYKIYHHSPLRILHFRNTIRENTDSNDIIKIHYAYLRSIKETVWFRYSLRKVLFFISMIVYLLFFFLLPNYYK